MNNKLPLVASFFLVAIVSAALAVMASFFYLAKPLQKGQGEYDQARLPGQASALQALRAGQPDLALAYLESVSSLSLIAMAERKDEGVQASPDQQVADAVRYLCSQPPAHEVVGGAHRFTLGEACTLLRQ